MEQITRTHISLSAHKNILYKMSFEVKDLVNNETDMYYIKYLKYKQKYIDLKEQLGSAVGYNGRPSTELSKEERKIIRENTTTPYYESYYDTKKQTTEFTNNSVVKGNLYLYS